MSYEVTTSKSGKSIQSVAFEKVSSFITRFHAVLLTKAHNSGVYRDLSEEQQYLLSNLQSDNQLHSILAGCLAIDSCLSNITHTQQTLTDNILKSLTNLCSTWQKIQNQLIQSVQTKSVTVSKVQQFWKQIQQSIRNLLAFCHDLPFSQQNDEIKKQQKIMSEQDISFKLGSMKLFQDPDQNNIQINIDLNSRLKLKQLQKQNIRLQQQLTFTQKKVVQLQLKNVKLQQNSQKLIEQQKSKEKYHQRKYSHPNKQQKNTQVSNKILSYLSPSSENTNQQKQHQLIYEENNMLKVSIKKMRQEYSRQKRKLLRQIKILQQQLKNAEENQDKELIQLLQELQEQIQSLRQQRRQDQRIIGQILHKLEGMNVTKQSRVQRTAKSRQIKGGNKALHALRDRVFFYDQINNEQQKSPTFKKSKERHRIYTKNDEVYKSSISMPKKNNYLQLQNQKYSWRADKLRQVKQQYPYHKNNYDVNRGLKYSQFIQRPYQNNYWSPQARFPRKENFTPRNFEQNQRRMKRNLYSGPLVQSKHGKQSFIKGQDKFPAQHAKITRLSYKTKDIEQQQQNNELQLQQQSRQQLNQINIQKAGMRNQKNYENVSNKIQRWQQIALSGPGQQLQQRLKTSRI